MTCQNCQLPITDTDSYEWEPGEGHWHKTYMICCDRLKQALADQSREQRCGCAYCSPASWPDTNGHKCKAAQEVLGRQRQSREHGAEVARLVDARVGFLEEQNASFRSQLAEVDALRAEADTLRLQQKRLERKIANQRTEIKNRRMQADEGERYLNRQHMLICLALDVTPSETGKAAVVHALIERSKLTGSDAALQEVVRVAKAEGAADELDRLEAETAATQTWHRSPYFGERAAKLRAEAKESTTQVEFVTDKEIRVDNPRISRELKLPPGENF